MPVRTVNGPSGPANILSRNSSGQVPKTYHLPAAATHTMPDV